MAIQKSLESNMGFTAPAAYIRISSFSGDKSVIRAQLEFYYDAAARTNEKRPIGADSVQLSIADGATLAQIYTALKALPQFAGAVDC